ncbi:hypothetical protein GCM10020331_101680 [Ectobacillus funiculus]
MITIGMKEWEKDGRWLGMPFVFKDPGMAQGIHDAIYGARILSNILSAYKGQSNPWKQMSEEYQKKAIEAEFMARFSYGMPTFQE